MICKKKNNQSEVEQLQREVCALREALEKSRAETAALTLELQQRQQVKLLEEALGLGAGERELYLSNLLRVMPEIVLFMNADLDVVMCSASYLKAAELERYDQIIGTPGIPDGRFDYPGDETTEIARQKLLATMQTKQLHEEEIFFSFVRGKERRHYRKHTLPVCDEHDQTIGVILLFIDLSEIIEAREEAQLDVLTKIYNRGAYETQVEHILGHDYTCNQPHAFIMIDFDFFKKINDSYGHLEGDTALQSLAAKLREHFRATDIVARMGGDEFAVFCPRVGSKEQIARRIEKLITDWRETMLVTEKGEEFYSTLSVGVAVASSEGISYKELFHRADIALYKSKKRGRDQYTIYDDGDGGVNGEHWLSGSDPAGYAAWSRENTGLH